MKNITLQSLQIFSLLYDVRKSLPLSAQKWEQFAHVLQIRYVENLRTSQGYIFRILHDFVTNFWNLTTFKMVFQGISFLSPGVAWIKNSYLLQIVF